MPDVFFQSRVDFPAQLLLEGGLFRISQPCTIVVSAGFWIFHDRQAVLQTQLVIHAPDRPGRAPEVGEFPGAVKGGGIDDDVIMNMVLIYMDEHTTKV